MRKKNKVNINASTNAYTLILTLYSANKGRMYDASGTIDMDPDIAATNLQRMLKGQYQLYKINTFSNTYRSHKS